MKSKGIYINSEYKLDGNASQQRCHLWGKFFLFFQISKKIYKLHIKKQVWFQSNQAAKLNQN